MATDIFSKEISIYNGTTDTIGIVATLGTFLFSKRHIPEILRLRSIGDEKERKAIKKRLPQAAISGIFSKRNKEGLTRHSGLICIDIDGKDNPDINLEETKNTLSGLQEIAYVSLSVGGRGLFCIVPIAFPNNHLEHFLSLQDDFKALGLTIDTACKDVCRMRCVSYDPTPIINPNPETYSYLKSQPQPIIKPYQHNDDDRVVAKVYELCRKVESFSIDMTANYQDWFSLGASLASMGEDGREAFHMVSRQNEKYNQRKCDKQFDYCLRKNGLIGIGTFFFYCKRYGLDC